MSKTAANQEREPVVARILRPLETGTLSEAQARQAANLLSVHWTTVYRLRKRFLGGPVAGGVPPRERILRPATTSWVPGPT
jgi:putative transposase